MKAAALLANIRLGWKGFLVTNHNAIRLSVIVMSVTFFVVILNVIFLTAIMLGVMAPGSVCMYTSQKHSWAVN